MKELESFSLGESWSVEMVTMSLFINAMYRYDSRRTSHLVYIYEPNLSHVMFHWTITFHHFSSNTPTELSQLTLTTKELFAP